MIIGLTGRVGAGKSKIASILAKKLKLTIIDLDKIGHQLLEKSRVKKQLEYTFGTSERPTLSKIVFSSPEELKKLNRIMHPLIKEEALKKIASKKPSLITGALIKEIGLRKYCDILFVADASDKTIIKRIGDKFSKIAPHQDSRETYINDADMVISNEKELYQ